MATSLRRKGIKAHLSANTRRSLSCENRRNRHDLLSNRRVSIDSIDSEYSDSDENGFDETDRCITNISKQKEDDPPFEDGYLSHPSDTSKTNRRLSSPNKIRKRRKLYPDLSDLEDDNVKKRHEGVPPFILIGVIFFLILFIFIIGHGYKSYQTNHIFMKTKTLEVVWKEMERDVISLSKVTHQSKRFWIQFLSQLKILTGEVLPIQPAIILAVVPSDSAKTAACFSQKLLEVISNAFDDSKYISFDVRSHMGRNSTVLKHNLEDFFQDLNRFHAAAVYNLEKLHPEAAMILHAYCDSENAPFKRVLYFFTLEIGSAYSSIDERNLDSTVSNYLTELWSYGGLRYDDIGAIVSRIANSPVLFRPEDKENILKHCPY
ncbi:Torsin-1A-interacting protein 1 [Armadillidium vulgare]|nr:Torsin-1A-interacting protein 1 [Armadillidium vulgare]